MRINSVSANYATQSTLRNSSNSKTQSSQKYSWVRDSVSISNVGRNFFGQQNKAQSMVSSLMEQRQYILDSKSTLLEKTLKSGDGMDSIKVELEAYQEQLDTIDEQIAKTLLEEQLKALETVKGQPDKARDNQPKTEEELQAEKMKDMVSISGDMDQMKVVSSSKNHLKGRTNVLKAEIKLDMASSFGVVPSKKVELSRLNSQVAALSEKLNDQIVSISEKVNEAQKPTETEPTSETKPGAETESEPVTLDTTA